MPKQKLLIIANWKCNPDRSEKAILLAQKTDAAIRGTRAEVVVVPPFPFLSEVRSNLKKAKLGAQDAFWTDGPYTGEVSSRQVKHQGAAYVILGHSERRIHLGETDEMINKKLKAVLSTGMTAILCVGESDRFAEAQGNVLGQQVRKALKDLKRAYMKRLVVAYEPVWAISTNPNAVPDTPDNAFRVSLYIRKIISDLFGRTASREIRIIYGGSVRSNNILAFLNEGKMQGALVGGASLDPHEFGKLLESAAKA